MVSFCQAYGYRQKGHLFGGNFRSTDSSVILSNIKFGIYENVTMKTALLKMDVEPHHYCSKLSRNHLGHFYRSGPRGEIYSLSDANSTYCVKRLLPCFVSRIICMDWTGQRGLCAVVDGLEIQVFAAQQPGGGIAKLQRPLRGCNSPDHARECTFDETGQYL